MKRPILLLFAALLWGGAGLLHAQAEAPFLPSVADARCKQCRFCIFRFESAGKSRIVDCCHLSCQSG